MAVWVRRLLLGFAAAAALLRPELAAAVCDALATPVPSGSRTELNLRAEGFDPPTVQVTWELRVSADCPELAQFRTVPIDDRRLARTSGLPPEGAEALRPFLACLGWTDEDDQDEMIATFLPARPRFAVEGGFVVLRLTVATDLAKEFESILGPWEVYLADRVAEANAPLPEGPEDPAQIGTGDSTSGGDATDVASPEDVGDEVAGEDDEGDTDDPTKREGGDDADEGRPETEEESEAVDHRTGTIVLRIAPDRLPPRQPLTVLLCVDGAESVSSLPLPDAHDGSGSYIWRVESRDRAPEIRVTPRLATRIGLRVQVGQWRYLRLVLGLLAPAAVLLVIPLVLAGRFLRDSGKPVAEASVGDLGYQQRSLARSGWLRRDVRALLLMVPGVAFAAWWLGWHERDVARWLVGQNRHLLSLIGIDDPSGRTGERDAKAFVETAESTLPVLACAVLFLASQGGWRRSKSFAVAPLIIAVFGILDRLHGNIVDRGRGVVDNPNLIYGAFVVGVAPTVLAIAAFLRFATEEWTAEGTRSTGGDGDRQTRSHVWSAVATWLIAGLVAATVLGQWTWRRYTIVDDRPPWLEDPNLTPGGALASAIANGLFSYPLIFFKELPPFLPFVVLAGLLGLLRAQGEKGHDVLIGNDELWVFNALALLYAGFVVGPRGELIGFALPLAFALAFVLVRVGIRRDVDAFERSVAPSGLPASTTQKPAQAFLTIHRKEILLRSLAISRIKVARVNLHHRHIENQIEEKDFIKEQSRLAARERLARTGSIALEPVSGRTNRPAVTSASVRLPAGTDPDRFALAAGPGSNWWANGIEALAKGALLSTVPLLYFGYVLVTTGDLHRLASAAEEFGVLHLLLNVLGEVTFWLIAALVFGCLYPYLPGRNGVLKGLALALVFVLARGIGALLLDDQGDEVWAFRSLQLLLFLSVLGLLLDWETLKRCDLNWRYLADHYQLRDARVIVSYASPMIVTLFAIIKQVRDGDAKDAVSNLISNLPTILPPLP